MEPTGRTRTEPSPMTPHPLGPVRAGGPLLAGALALGGCHVVPAQTAYAPPRAPPTWPRPPSTSPPFPAPQRRPGLRLAAATVAAVRAL